MNPLTLTTRIRAAPERVYRALLDPTLIPRWRVPSGMTCIVHEFEPRVGGRFRISLTYDGDTNDGKSDAHTDTYAGHFEELVPNRRVVEVLAFETTDPAFMGRMRIVTELTATTDGTELSAAHEGLPAAVSPSDNEVGWRESLAKLAALVEEGRTL